MKTQSVEECTEDGFNNREFLISEQNRLISAVLLPASSVDPNIADEGKSVSKVKRLVSMPIFRLRRKAPSVSDSLAVVGLRKALLVGKFAFRLSIIRLPFHMVSEGFKVADLQRCQTHIDLHFLWRTRPIWSYKINERSLSFDFGALNPLMLAKASSKTPNDLRSQGPLVFQLVALNSFQHYLTFSVKFYLEYKNYRRWRSQCLLKLDRVCDGPF